MNNRARKQIKSSKTGKFSQSVGLQVRMHPPQISNYELRHTMPLRFTVTAAIVNFGVTYVNLLDTILFATTAIAPYRVFDAVKLVKVRVWASAALGTPTTVSVSFRGDQVGVTGDHRLISDTSLGFQPAFVEATPLQDSVLYQGIGAGAAFTLTAPAGSIIEVHMQMRNDDVATAAANVSVGATVGGIFYRGLDGLAAAGTNIPPLTGLPTF
jgi:hypothetical protein